MSKIPERFDVLIREACEQHFPGVDWRRLKAQLYAESRLKLDAVSPSGAQGIAQFMPTTWPEVRAGIGAPSNATPFDAEYAIPGAAWYMNELYADWSSWRSDLERWRLALASYNAGYGNITRAMRRAGSNASFEAMIVQLPHVTGHDNAMQTINYINRIEQYYEQLIA